MTSAIPRTSSSALAARRCAISLSCAQAEGGSGESRGTGASSTWNRWGSGLTPAHLAALANVERVLHPDVRLGVSEEPVDIGLIEP